MAAILASPMDVAPSAATAAVLAPRNEFEKFLVSVQGSNAKPKVIDQFMSAQKTFPVVEDGWVHFVYRGQADDVAMSGSMTEYQVEDALRRVEGTDLFYRSYAIDGPTRWEYRFNVDFENPQPDPLNPRRIQAREGELSEVTAGGWKASPWREPYAGDSPGRVEQITLTSEILGNERSIDVYLPRGYDDGQERYPLVVATDGQGWNDLGHMPNVLDHLTGDASAPVIVAFVRQPDGAQAELGGPKTDDYARMIVDELVPQIDATYRTLARPDARAILGAGGGGAVAVVVALTQPDVFGKVAATSVYLGSAAGQKLPATIEAFDGDATRPVFVISWNRDELVRTDWNVDIGQDTQRLVQMLKEHGFEVEASQADDASGWGAWPVRAGEMLVALFPPS